MNTLAGFGSIITLSILMDGMGLPGNVANGTNRVNVLAGCGASSYGFYKGGKLDIKKGKWFILLTFIGAMIGVTIALNISNDQFKVVFKYLVLVMLGIILIRPKRWLREQSEDQALPWLIAIPIFLGLGFYGGFIQMGAGLFYLAALVLLAKYNLVEANAIKVFMVLVYTIVVLAIFHWNGLVDWKAGGLLAIGQLTGGYLTAQFASKYKKANVWAYRILVLIVIFVIARNFGLIDWLMQQFSS